MVDTTHKRLGFRVSITSIRNNIFVPRNYDQILDYDLQRLDSTHDLYTIRDLLDDGHVELSTGHEIGKMAYGTGSIPFIRTSDISNWELKTDPKQGVSQTIYEEFSSKQDVQAGDILFVKDGTYLIGQSCIVMEQDLPFLYQSHIYRIRLNASAPISTHVFFAALNSPIVKRQIKSKQFTADIIDSIGSRILDLVLPVPKDEARRQHIDTDVRNIFARRVHLRENMRKVPLLAQGILQNLDEEIWEDPENIDVLRPLSFIVSSSSIRSNIFIPKYYDVALQNDLHALSATHDLVDIETLIREGMVIWNSGIEVGKMAYGTGTVPFVRTSDISNWELKSDPKHLVSEEIYEANKQDVAAQDILIVSDGTYLIGTSCMITANETKILYSGGVDRLRVIDRERLNPYLLLALLNTPIVKRQIRSKQFTRDIIDTLSRRILEIFIPIPKDPALLSAVSQITEKLLEERVVLRHTSQQLVTLIDSISLE